LRYILLLAIAVLTLSLVGCYEDDPPPYIPPSTFDLSTPGKTLQTYSYIITVNRYIYDYESLLRPGYRFYFNPADVGKTLKDGYVIPEYWDNAEDCTATSKMFEQAYNMEMTVKNWEDYDVVPEVTTYTAHDVQIEFYIYPASPDFAELTSGICDVDFEKIDGYWYIIKWFDKTSGYGYIRAAYN
jgi:hypothetical protein